MKKGWHGETRRHQEAAYKNRMKKTPQREENLFYEIGAEEGLYGEQLSTFVDFMETRFPKERHGPYIAEWAGRWKKGPWNYSDYDTRKVLKQVLPQYYGWDIEKSEYYDWAREGWEKTIPFSTYKDMIEYIDSTGKEYIGLTHYSDGTFVGYYK